MKRRTFLSITGTFTGGALVLPEFLYAFARQKQKASENHCLVFVQLNGGNDGLNTYIPFSDPIYYDLRPKIGIKQDQVIAKNQGMGLHPDLKGLGDIQQNGDLTIIQNVGYPNPNRSHFRSQEIWQTASEADQYLTNGWLGRFLDLQCKDHTPTAGINIDAIDNLAFKGEVPNTITVKNPNSFKVRGNTAKESKLDDNPQLDFVMKIAQSVTEGSESIQEALGRSKEELTYPKSKLANHLKWIGRLIKGNLNSKVYYTSLGGFDTHDNQIPLHKRRLTELDSAISSFYKDMKQANLMQDTTIVVFSEFGRRVKDNGSGTDHGTAAPMFIISGNSNGQIIGKNPDLQNLSNGDLVYDIDFRSVYARLLKNRMNFDPKLIGINNKSLESLF
ncbi:DUF1501 domain-containing protein [Spongiivirga citrea]|uniref:DUF1501 domain-containing protein n=1 Tax=Spongiivirga citrea TaxID=1481457 RepID=A0A6M0CIT5_9FLAO|nr:DUF1501 domain-containing protein [Spongiivirga citrea]NER17858.1 DUF1501 domain-containing protein [Spongiivirga citrea]